jgi:iron complex outermembrane receptor protein
MMKRFQAPAALALLVLLIASASAAAQTGTLRGQVTDAAGHAPLRGATVRATRSGDATLRQSGAVTGADGYYRIADLPAGRYRVTVTYVGYAAFTSDEVTVGEGKTVDLDVAMKSGAVGFNEVVVSASRRPEKITEAPASVTVIGARQVEAEPSLTVVEHLKGVQGVDIVQSGLIKSNVVARGFNNAFSGTLMTLTDNRIASVPSLRVNAYYLIPLIDDDIEQIELIRGPGSALYGPNTANGVLHMITKSPFSSAGTTVSISGGEREVFQGSIRHAGVISDRLAYKITGQYMRGLDWDYADPVEDSTRRAILADTVTRVNPDTLKIGMRDRRIARAGGELRVDWLPVDEMTATLAVGLNRAIRNIDVTGVGAAQVRNWDYSYYQAKLSYKDLFLQAFLNRSSAGQTYLLRTGAPIVDRSTQFVAQAQQAFSPAEIERITTGADLILTNPVTDSTITGVNEGHDGITEIGAYVQSETKIVPGLLDLVAAGRLDYHNHIDGLIFSPRAALVYTPLHDQTVRFTYNRAYSAPTTNDLFMDIVATSATVSDSNGALTKVFDVRATSATNGFTFAHASDGSPLMHGFPFFGYDASHALPLDSVGPVWRTVQKLVRDATGGAFSIDSLPAPSRQALLLKMLNPATRLFDTAHGVRDYPAIGPTITSTFELGYKGVIADRIALSVDLYTSKYDGFIGPVQVFTPNVFFRRDSLISYISSYLVSKQFPADLAERAAEALADTVAQLPFATVSPQEAYDPTAVMLTNRNYGSVTLYGYDVGMQAALAYGLSFNASISYVDKNFFRNLDDVSDLSLNAPKLKYSLGLEYGDAGRGLAADVLFRRVGGFSVNSGVYIGEVAGYSTVDLNASCRVPFVDGLTVALRTQNLLTWVDGQSGSPFTQRHQEFVGAAPIGRLALVKLSYTVR